MHNDSKDELLIVTVSLKSKETDLSDNSLMHLHEQEIHSKSPSSTTPPSNFKHSRLDREASDDGASKVLSYKRTDRDFKDPHSKTQGLQGSKEDAYGT